MMFSSRFVILFENSHALFEEFVLVVSYERRANPEPFLMTSCSDEADGTHTIIHQFASQLSTCHSGIADGEIKAVGDGFPHILVIYDVEAVPCEDVLQFLRPFAIDLHLVAEGVGSVASRLHDGSKCKLCTMAGARGECV